MEALLKFTLCKLDIYWSNMLWSNETRIELNGSIYQTILNKNLLRSLKVLKMNCDWVYQQDNYSKHISHAAMA